MLQSAVWDEWDGLPRGSFAEHVAAALERSPGEGDSIMLPKLLLVTFQLTTCASSVALLLPIVI